ncbi:MAG: hypothetical protein JSV33_00700 [bacterium]|nr:MAG: hypothetical protein JSV33_00700 [bacterium]
MDRVKPGAAAYRKSAATIVAIPLLLSLFLLLLLAGCNEQTMESPWAGEPIQIDGMKADWNELPTFYFEREGVQFGVCNDTTNLYVLFRFTGEQKARLISVSGLTLWFDSAGEKKRTFGIHFAGRAELSMMPGRGMRGGRMRDGVMGESGMDSSDSGMGARGDVTAEQLEEIRRMRFLLGDEITVIDGVTNEKSFVPVDGSRGPRAAFTGEKGIYTYEFSIPLSPSDENSYGIGAAPGQTIGLGMEWGMDRDDMKRTWGERKGRMPGEPGGGGMGGMPGGRGPGRRMQSPKKVKIWLQVPLAAGETEDN